MVENPYESPRGDTELVTLLEVSRVLLTRLTPPAAFLFGMMVAVVLLYNLMPAID